MAATATGRGYWLVASDGGIFSLGDAQFFGSMGGRPLAQPVVGMAATPDARGYWEVASDGGIFSFGSGRFLGSMGGRRLNQPVVGMARTADAQGYWEVASDGGIFSFGNAQFYGSMGGHALFRPVVGMASTPSGHGYWLVAADGGIFTFGDAPFYGSTGGRALNRPVVGMAPTADGRGYWLVAADGGVFSFGDAQFYGSMGGRALNQPMTGMAATVDGKGYWTVAGDGGVFSFGDAQFAGSLAPYVIGDVPYYKQVYELSCEEAALQMALAHAHINVTQAKELADEGIDGRAGYYDSTGTLRWGNANLNFVGDPNGSEVALTGYGTYNPTIARIASSYGANVLVSGQGVAPATVYNAVLNNHPVVAWVAFDWRYHSPGSYLSFDNQRLIYAGPIEHAVTIVGVGRDSVLVNNPWSGPQWMDKGTFEGAFATYNNMAVVIA